MSEAAASPIGAPADARTDPRKARSRRAVLAAALETVQERGLQGATIEAVAQRSGVARTTIYRQWSSPGELVLDALATVLDAPPPVDSGTLRGDLELLLGGLVAALASGPAASLMPLLMDAAERDPAFAELHRREASARHRVVLDAIRRGIDRGELPAGTDPDLVLDLLAGPVFYRRFVSGGVLDEAFVAATVDAALVGARAVPQP